MPNPIMKYFDYAHLPGHLQMVSQPIGDLARQMDLLLPDCAEKTAGLRKLLEAKDCLVRAKLEDLPTPIGQANTSPIGVFASRTLPPHDRDETD